MFKEDIDFLTANHLSLDEVEKQVSLIRKGNPVVKLLRPATLGDGILELSESHKKSAISRAESRDGITVCKFVPASGAATRMFKDLQQWIEKPESYVDRIGAFMGQIEMFAFYNELKECCKRNGVDLHSSELMQQVRVLDLLVGEDGLGYASLPKALIPFHTYGGEIRKAMAEHFIEGASYARTGNEVHLHFTISPEHEDLFLVESMRLKSIFEERYGLVYKINWSFQDPATDTVALIGKELARDGYGNPLIRPGGHGALVGNLNKLSQDVVFIKNIDNVSHESHLSITTEWKKTLMGILLELRDDIHYVMKVADSEARFEGMATFSQKWGLVLPEKKKELKKFLDRPIRVCGMVKNEGEPGGGPFWVEGKDGKVSLQIVEKAQVELENANQRRIISDSTHFNPVDMVCYLKNSEGERFNLTEFVDNNSYLVTTKTQQGQEMSVLEWPGLWNGGMADWITVFVAVPIETFNPVKTVFDLVRGKHLV